MRGKLTISLEAVKQNYQLLNQKTGNAVVAAVVKANAYGLGIEPIAKTLDQSNVKNFFVALAEEGIELRKILPDADIYVLNGVFTDEKNDFIEHRLIPVINDKSQAALWSRDYPCALHVDTGLNRLGFNLKEFEEIEMPNARLVMSHLACADTPEHPINAIQLSRFIVAAARYSQVKKSLAASDGVFCGSEFHFDMVRPGAALYGLNPQASGPNPMQPVIQLSVPVLQTRIVEQDGFVGYAATHKVKKGQILATVSLGYADGFFRSLSNTGQLYYKGKTLPVLGRVSMDVITVDITNAPELRAGDWVDVFGQNQSPDDLAKSAGTIGYEVLTALGDRFERVYTS